MITILTDRARVPFIIDDDDAEAVSRYAWRINPDGYPEATIGKWPTNRSITLHLFLMGPAPEGLEWDHVNRDPRDNRRANLRAVTHKANTRNFGLRSTNRSGVPGVRQRGNRWRAEICVDGKMVHLGTFADLAAAATARRTAELELWGEAPA